MLYSKEGNMETRKKGSHLNIEERRQIAILDKEGWSPYKETKEGKQYDQKRIKKGNGKTGGRI